MPSRLDVDTFIKRSRNTHGDLYDYSEVVYKDRKTPVEILCKTHGSFLQRPEVHAMGSGCPACAGNKVMSTDSFVKKAIKVHGDRYEYSLVEYKNSQSYVNIVCKKHSVFRQKPAMHLSGQGCPSCYGSKKKSLVDFILAADDVHKGAYDYSLTEYVNRKTPVTIICRSHGEFQQRPYSHLNGNGCPSCAGVRKKTTEQFTMESSAVHQGFYNYDKTNYTGSKCLVVVTCPLHGDFEQLATYHRNGHGCPDCGLGWGSQRFKELIHRAGKGLLYVVNMFNSNESFYKIGITSRSVKVRFKFIPYDYKVIKEIAIYDGDDLYTMEKRVHNRFKKNRYNPLLKFDGSTECFSDINIQGVLDYIDEIRTTMKGE